jgi:hypothetical protein
MTLTVRMSLDEREIALHFSSLYSRVFEHFLVDSLVKG